MKKLVSFLSVVLFLCLSVNLFAQVANYTFSQRLGTYTEIAGDTVVAFSTSTITNPMDLDDVTYPSNRIPFSFRFNGVVYTNFAINTNGFITFGTTPPVAANYGPIAATEVYDGAVSGFGINLIGLFGTTATRVAADPVLSSVASFAGVVTGRLITGTGIATSATIISFNSGAGTITMSAGATSSSAVPDIIQIAAGSIVRSTQGIAPLRVHIIQFKNFRRNTTTGTVDNLNFQIKLFETTGVIHVVYGNINEGPISVSGQVGLRGALATDFNNRTTTTDWLNTTPGTLNSDQCLISSTVFPPLGLTFIWTHDPLVLPVEMSSFVSLVNGRDVTLNWTTASENNNSHFNIERSMVNGQWSMVGSVQGNGTTLSSMNYSFTDRGLNTGLYYYRLKQIDFNGNFKYYNLNNEVNVGIPTKFDLLQNYPNPFNPSTKINYDLPFDGKVTLKIFDMSGKEVSTLVDDVQVAGYYTINFNASNLSSGIYLYKISANANGNNFVATKKMMLVK